MAEYGCIFPEYGFENHNGYGTEFHLNALKENRATPIHRRSFKPVSNKMPTLSWLSEQNKIGWMGEKLAALYLKGKGFKIVEIPYIQEKDIDPIKSKSAPNLIKFFYLGFKYIIRVFSTLLRKKKYEANYKT